MNILKGKLTYLIAGITLLWAVVGFLLNTLDGQTASEMVLASLAVFGIRRAIANK